ncbi:MAG: AzlC family ABC transporter permease [Rhodobacter sp.]|nr:AzlC family ABC transporter permease [Rhodobacter sp.]
MSAPAPRTCFWRGFRAGLPFVIVVAPFAGLFGVVATDAGLSITEVMAFSVLVIAGAAQFTALQLMTENAPTAIVLATALAVNLRMAMYSAALVPHLGSAPLGWRVVLAYFNVDQTYALSQAAYDDNPTWPVTAKVAFFLGTAIPICPMWYVFTWAGAALGTRIPPEFALDFAVPITFLALIAPALRTAAHVAAAGTSIAAALALAWMPAGLGLICAGIVAMMVGARVETWLEARA